MPKIPQEVAKRVLKEMTKQGHWEEGSLIWEGALSTLIAKHGALSRYSEVIGLLKASGAAVQLRRGGGKSHSRWQVLETSVNFADVKPSTSLAKRSTLAKRVDSLERFTKTGLAELAIRLEKLERKVDA